MPNSQIGKALTEMRTGYSRLNKYRNNIGQSLTPLCDCGEEETTEHYILHCQIYEHANHYTTDVVHLARKNVLTQYHPDYVNVCFIYKYYFSGFQG
jgi:hypothetical protein